MRDRTALAHFIVEFFCGGIAVHFGGWPAGLAVLAAVLAQCSWEVVRREREKAIDGADSPAVRSATAVFHITRALATLDTRAVQDSLLRDHLTAARDALRTVPAGVPGTRCTYPKCDCARPEGGGCGDPRAYTDAIGQAGEDYLKQFPHAHALPAQWRWSELWDRMNAAHGVEGQQR